MEPPAPRSSSFELDSAGKPDPSPSRKKPRRSADPHNQKRRCVSTACVACRRRKSKCDGALPSCAACASVYGTDCVYDPNSDHRRKGVYKEKVDSTKANESTLQILIEAILNAAEDDVHEIVRQIRTCDNLDAMATSLVNSGHGIDHTASDDDTEVDHDYATTLPMEGERDLARKMGELRLENGSVRFIGGTSHLIYLGTEMMPHGDAEAEESVMVDANPITSWTNVTEDPQVVIHLLNMYWNWHYPYFTTLSRSLFYRDFLKGKSQVSAHRTAYCSALLVNAMLALGCHFTNVGVAYAVPGDSWTKGDHFFTEAKRLIMVNDEYEKPRLTTVQALALMSVREAGCGREAKGWVYSGMSFRMAQDLGLNMDIAGVTAQDQHLDEKEVDARRVTFWGCFLFDKCWSNYLGRLPQIPKNSFNVPKYDVFPDEDAQDWSPYTDTGYDEVNKQPSRTRAVGLQLLKLSEISSDLLLFFYHPNHIGRSHSKSVELKKLSELHRRLEDWRKDLPKELEPKDGQLPNVILMHMFFHLQYIHLFRPFLRYAPNASPLPSHVSPRRMCTANAGAISKLMRLYKKTYNLRQICNIAVYMLHSACTIHLLNLPEKTAKRDIVHGVKHLEEIAEDWLCGRRTLSIISVLARKWNCELPEEAAQVLQRTDERWGFFSTSDVPSPRSLPRVSPSPSLRTHSPE
ncbi:fungal-specific transcription factor domain-containing protein, partial [Microdochium trichocladiopsis]